MGKPRFPTLSAGVATGSQPQDSWMTELQVQTVAVDAARWLPQARQPVLWHTFAVRSRSRRTH